MSNTIPNGNQSFAGQSGQAIPTRASPPSTENAQITTSTESQKRQEKITNAKLLGGAGIIATILGIAFKDGLKKGFLKTSNFFNSISNIVSLPFAVLYPFGALESERASSRKEQKGKDDLFMRGLYTAASVAFAPNTVGGPAKDLTRSPAHMVTGLMNTPHWLFCLFSYTGARLLSFFKIVQKERNTDPEKKYRLEQEFEALYTLGNIGSSQVSVIPMASQCVTGWQTLKDIFTGNIGSAWERFKHEPISVGLGTLFNWWAWPFEYVAKFLDTTIRATENVEQFENAFPEGSRLIGFLKNLKIKWHNKAKEDNALGKFLKYGREFSKIEALLLPPIGMISVVIPTFNKFARGEFWNKEAQDIGGIIGLLDKAFSTVAFFSHIFYTGIYAASVRLPQTISTATFYLSHLLKRVTGKDIEPTEIRDKIFGGKLLNKISNWAAKKLDEGELEFHKDEPILINDQKDKDGNIMKKGTGRCRHIRTFIEILAQETYFPIRESFYGLTVKARDDHRPTDSEWGVILKGLKNNILEESGKKLEEYLSNSGQLDSRQIREFEKRGYFKLVTDEVRNLIKKEIETTTDPKIIPEQDQKIKSKSWKELFTNPGDIKELIKGKMFHITNSILPLWVKGFVNALDMGEKDEPFWLRNLKATVTGINELDIVQACNRELMPVVAYAFQTAGKGMAILHGLKRLVFNGEPMPSLYEEAA